MARARRTLADAVMYANAAAFGALLVRPLTKLALVLAMICRLDL